MTQIIKSNNSSIHYLRPVPYMAKVTHYGCPAPKAMLGGGDVTGWAVEHAVAKVEGEALARMSGGEHSKQRQVRSLIRSF